MYTENYNFPILRGKQLNFTHVKNHAFVYFVKLSVLKI